MLRNYLVTALRRMARQRGFTAINLLGLALGIVCCLCIFLMLQFELGFDRWHRLGDRIVRVVTIEHINGTESETMGSPAPMAAALRTEFPALENVTTSVGLGGGLFEISPAGTPAPGRSGNGADTPPRRFQEEQTVAYLEPAFFQIFDFPWAAGSPASLAEPNTVALTESIARKFFGTTDVVGQTLTMDNKIPLKVVGLLKDFPVQTDFRFTMAVSYKTMENEQPWMKQSWRGLSSNVNTWVLLQPGHSMEELQRALPALKEKYDPDAKDPDKRVYAVQPLRDVHHDGRFGNYAMRTVSRATLLGLGVIGIFLLVTACINFINMATAQALTRAREVGVRKVLGAVRGRLITQYLGETFLLTLFSALLAGALAEVLLPGLNELLGISLTLSVVDNPLLGLFLVGLILVVSLLAGLYPAFIMSGFTPVLALKGRAERSIRSGSLLRRGLVIFQFVISQMLIIGTIVVSAQMEYVRAKELGFNKDALVLAEIPQNEPLRLQTLKTLLQQDSRIRGVTFSYESAASPNVWDATLRHTMRGREESYTSDLKFGDAQYIPTYGMQIIAGRNYQPSDSITEIVVNETFARKLGMQPQELLGKTLLLGKRPPVPVVGVVKDFNARPLQEEVRPVLLAANQKSYHTVTCKIDGADIPGALAHIERSWSKVFPEFLFSSQFLDQRIESFYKEEQKTAQLFRVFTAIALFIGTIGLFGLVSFMAARRTKEIGVRKVLGATVGDILVLFLREFALLVLIAFALAAPVAYLVMSRWLEDFAYRIAIGPEVFTLGLAAAFAIAGVSVGYRVIRAALSNPVNALRYE